MTISHSREETFELGRRFASSLRAGDVIGLIGNLGAGKTQFVKGLAAGLGSDSEVTSPTFTLVHEHEGGRLPLYHIDLYRLGSLEEACGAGIDDFFVPDGVAVVEWADRLPELMPRASRILRFVIGNGDIREIVEESAS